MNIKGITAPVMLVTGCSSGIGLALAKQLARDLRFRVVITARKKSIELLKSQFLEDERFLIRELDITDDNQLSDLVNEITILWGGIDILVNNAGIAYRSVIEQMDEESEMHQLKTNYLGPMSLIRLVIPTMREKGYGHIINVSSVSGMMSMPTMGSYSASKHALEAATEALWYEVKPFGVQVNLVQPGFVHSESFKNVYLSAKARFSSRITGPYADVYQSIAPFIERLMKLSRSTPDHIAEKIIRTCLKEKTHLRQSVTIDAVLFGILKKMLPRRWFHKVMFYLLPSSQLWGRKRKTKHHPDSWVA